MIDFKNQMIRLTVSQMAESKEQRECWVKYDEISHFGQYFNDKETLIFLKNQEAPIGVSEKPQEIVGILNQVSSLTNAKDNQPKKPQITEISCEYKPKLTIEDLEELAASRMIIKRFV